MNKFRSIGPASLVIWTDSALFRAMKSLASGRNIAFVEKEGVDEGYLRTS
jgi:hypothetical protein